jgi:hypothetical protein
VLTVEPSRTNSLRASWLRVVRLEFCAACITWFKFSSNNLVQSNLNPIFFKYPVKNLDNLNYKNKDLLIIGGGHHKYVQYCSHFPEASQRLEQIIDLKKFTQNLKKNIKSHVFLKPHPFYVKENNTFDYINLYKNIAKIKNFSKKNEDIISSINRSKILVCVYPETTFSEALIAFLMGSLQWKLLSKVTSHWCVRPRLLLMFALPR